MGKYLITTDTTADLPESYIQEAGLGMMSLSYTIDGVTYDRSHELPVKEFYAKMRAGSMPTTAQVNPESARETFLQMMEEHDADILHLAFSSGLSGSCNSALLAAAQLKEEYKDHQVTVIDTLAASLGEGLLVHKALENQKKGMSLEENAKWLEENKLHLVHNFTVDDLFHLHRGGRVSKTAAVIGTMINLKPVLHVDNEGHLIPVSKVRGRKKSLIALVDAMEKQMGSYRDQNDIVFISHGDCEEEARFVADLVRQRFGIEKFLINYVGPTIGAHSGPGTMALFYLGEYR